MIRFDYEAHGDEGRLVLFGPLGAEQAPELKRTIRRCLASTPHLVLRVNDGGQMDEACLRVVEASFATGRVRSTPENERSPHS